jgi:hypothetical protein
MKEVDIETRRDELNNRDKSDDIVGNHSGHRQISEQRGAKRPDNRRSNGSDVPTAPRNGGVQHSRLPHDTFHSYQASEYGVPRL